MSALFAAVAGSSVLVVFIVGFFVGADYGVAHEMKNSLRAAAKLGISEANWCLAVLRDLRDQKAERRK